MFTEALSQSEFLRQIPSLLRPRLAALATPHEVAAGTVLFREHQQHNDLYLVESGHVRIEMTVPGRGRVAVLSVGPGDVLAWSPLLGAGEMTATATAIEPSRLWSLPGERLRELCDSDHEVGYHVMRQMARALSQRLIATRLQLLDLFGEHTPRG